MGIFISWLFFCRKTSLALPQWETSLLADTGLCPEAYLERPDTLFVETHIAPQTFLLMHIQNLKNRVTQVFPNPTINNSWQKYKSMSSKNFCGHHSLFLFTTFTLSAQQTFVHGSVVTAQREML